jgi:hypothetical protein
VAHLFKKAALKCITNLVLVMNDVNHTWRFLGGVYFDSTEIIMDLGVIQCSMGVGKRYG